jgi:hypothetical protein
MKTKKENYEFDTKNEYTRHEARLNGNTSLIVFSHAIFDPKYQFV